MKIAHQTAVALLTGGSLFALSSAAFAQAASAPSSAPAAVQEIVVTGSRVIVNGNNSPTPVTVLPTQQMMELQPTTVADALNELPTFTGSQGQTSNPGNSGGNGAANQLNLRDLGAVRTLILYDGHRVEPTSPTGIVDVDMIPQLLLQRVDVVTGGASAVYGSDAVAGVVNFVTDAHFNGLKFNASTGVSQYGDDKISDLALAGGVNIMGGRGHFEASYEYYNDPGVFTKLNRPWGRDTWTIQGTGTAANPYHLVENTRLANSSFAGVILSGPLSGQEFNQNGVLSPFVHGTPTGSNNIESGGDGGYYYTASLKSALQSHQAFARFDYDLTDSLHVYSQFSGTLNYNHNNHQSNEFRSIAIGVNNAFLTPAQQAAAAATGASTFSFSKMITQAPPLQSETHEKQWTYVFGLEGRLLDYKWQATYEHSDSIQATENPANINLGHAYAALNAVVNPSNGQIVCHPALTNAAYSNCVPLNLFGPTSESAAALAYILTPTEYWAHTHMDDFSASIAGTPFKTWAGPVNMAVSGEWRTLGYALISDAQPTDHPDCAGIQYNCTANTPLYISNTVANRSPVGQTVGEVAYETDIPLVADVPFVQAFNLNGAVRYTNYDTSGSAWTWKIGFDWHVTDELTVRATRSRDIRAPNLNDLFAPASYNPAGYVDLHTGVQNQVTIITSSNPNLKPEDADTTTAGFVWRPHFLPRFSLSVDAFRITLNNAILSVSGNTAAVAAACEASGGTSPYCALYVRPFPFSNHTAANFPSAVLAYPQNIASIDTYGADIEANYAGRLLDRNFTLRGLFSYQPHILYNNGPGGFVDMGDSATGQTGTQPSPSMKATIIGKYDITSALSLSMLERWRDGLRWTGLSSQIFSSPRIPSIEYTDATLSYTVKQSFGSTEFYLNVKNVFNQQPVPAGNTGGSQGVPGLFGGYVLGDDTIGRYFMLGLRFRH